MVKPVTTLYEEIRQRFPELHGELEEYERELPYELMRHVAEWVSGFGERGLSAGVAQRVVDFARWCERQPRGETARDDLVTVVAVGLYEPLFESPTTRALLPKLFTRADLVSGAEYLKSWVGEDNYLKALDLFPPTI